MEQTTYNTHEAKTHLSKLIARVQAGEEIIIAQAGKPAARLLALESPKPQKPREPGLWAGKIWYADDWDSPETNAAIGGDFVDAPLFPSEDDE